MKQKIDSGNGRMKTAATPKQNKWADPFYVNARRRRRVTAAVKPFPGFDALIKKSKSEKREMKRRSTFLQKLFPVIMKNRARVRV